MFDTIYDKKDSHTSVIDKLTLVQELFLSH